MIKVRLPDGKEREYNQGVSFIEIARSIGPGLAKAAFAVKANNVLKDLSESVEEDISLEIITNKNPEAVEIVRHSSAHILAMAAQRLWPGTKVTIGPIIEAGFYYDFQFPESVRVTEADLPRLEEEMKTLMKQNLEFKREVVTREEAIRRFKELNETFKIELIEELPPQEKISIYHTGDWFDLCRGPHVPNTSKLGAFKLTSVAGSYWRGDEKRERLVRIYGAAFLEKKELDEYLERIEEARKRDHRIIGKELDLFSFHKEAPAHAFFHPKGLIVYNKLIGYMRRSNIKFGFKEIATPFILNVDLWHRSGHFDNYRDNMYFTMVDDVQAAVKPMNCPGHLLIYNTKRRSYRELPLRMAEFGRVHRHERSGVTHGLNRVRSFVQDDAHVFCTLEQAASEIKMIITQLTTTYSDLGFKKYRVELSTRPAKSIGSDEVWETSEGILKRVLSESGLDYQLNPGDGAFYGPKIDFHLTDSIGRSWQCGTIQLDFSMPMRFNLEYLGPDDKPYTPVMIHRAVYGSLERFLGVFIEHYAGHFPLWASPLQVRVMNVTDKQQGFCQEVQQKLQAAGVLVDLDLRNEKLGYKIREAQIEKIPYMVIIGDKEMDTRTITPRKKDGTNLTQMDVNEFIQVLKDECQNLWGI